MNLGSHEASVWRGVDQGLNLCFEDACERAVPVKAAQHITVIEILLEP